MKTPIDRPRLQGSVDPDDLAYFRTLCGNEHGLRSAAFTHLFAAFVKYLKTLDLQPYHVNNDTPTRIRRLLAVGEFTVGRTESFVVSRTAGGRTDHT